MSDPSARISAPLSPSLGASMGADSARLGGLSPIEEARVRRLLLVMRRPVSAALSGAYRSLVRGSGVEFEEVRPYQVGDDVRGIDWNVTARTGEPYVKTYREERQLELQLLIDASPSMAFGTAESTKRQKAAELAALLAAACSLSRDALELDLFSKGPLVHVPRRRGSADWTRVHYAALTTAGPPAQGADLIAAAVGLARHLRRRHAVFVVSDFQGFEDAAWEVELSTLGQRHDLALVRLIDPFEERLPKAGCLWLEDAELGGASCVDTSNARVRAAWEARAVERREDFERRAASFGLPHFTLRTDQPASEPLVAFLKRMARRGAGGGR